MQKWVKQDRTLVCLAASAQELEQLNGDARFYDEDLGFTTAIAFRPMTEEIGRNRFGNFRLA